MDVYPKYSIKDHEFIGKVFNIEITCTLTLSRVEFTLESRQLSLQLTLFTDQDVNRLSMSLHYEELKLIHTCMYNARATHIREASDHMHTRAHASIDFKE